MMRRIAGGEVGWDLLELAPERFSGPSASAPFLPVCVDDVEPDAMDAPRGREEGMHRDVVGFATVDQVSPEPAELSFSGPECDPVTVERSREHGLGIGTVPMGAYLGRILVRPSGLQLGAGDPSVALLD